MLLTMQHAYKIRNYFFPNPERLDKINEVIIIKEFINF